MIETIELQQHLKSLTLLYVEDEKTSRELCAEFLNRLVAVLITANNGAEGLIAYHQHKPDIIISDIRMPVMDGLTMLQEIRSVDQEVPVIILSAFETPEYIKRSIDLNVNEYLFKPANINNFAASLLKCARGLYDIAEKKSLLAELVVAKEQAETANQAKSDFLDLISHEIRTPMNAVTGMTGPQLEKWLILETGLEAKITDELPLFDESEMLIRLDNDRDLLRMILDMSLQDLPARLEKFREQRIGDDMKALLVQTHTLKGVAANISARALWDICTKFETVAKKGDLEPAQILLSELELTLERTIEAFGTY
jgi:CheY-like chemotaxis protein